MPNPRAPRFEAFALEPTDSGDAGRQAVERAVAEVLGPEWRAEPFGEGADLDDGTAWEESYRLEEQPGIAWTEPLFTVQVIKLRSEDDDLTVPVPFSAGGYSGPPPDPEWSVKLVEAGTLPNPGHGTSTSSVILGRRGSRTVPPRRSSRASPPRRSWCRSAPRCRSSCCRCAT